MEHFSVEPGQYGLELHLRSRWSDRIEGEMTKFQINGLSINYNDKSEGGDVEFLRRLPWLRSLKIIDRTLKDLSPVSCLAELRQLQIDTPCKRPLDFKRLVKIESLHLTWCTGSESLFELPHLRTLSILHLPTDKVGLLERAELLETLGISACAARSLDSLRALRRLRRLSLAMFRQLESNSFLADLTELRELDVTSCSGFRSLEPLRCCKSLRRLSFLNGDPIESLEPLLDLHELQRFGLYDDAQVADGKVSHLLSIESLRSATFKNRRRYDAKLAQMPQEPWTLAADLAAEEREESEDLPAGALLGPGPQVLAPYPKP